MNDELARELIDNIISIRVQLERQTEKMDRIETQLQNIVYNLGEQP
jgi:hypothetical protein